MKIFLPFLLAVVLLSSCKKECHRHQPPPDHCAEPQITIGDCITDSNQIKTLILGKWNWTQTIPGWSVTEQNPCTENKTYSYEFSSNGSIKHFENGEQKESVYYHFINTTGTQIILEDSIQHLYHPLSSPTGWLRVCGNYLVIDNSPVDGAKVTFLRQN